MPKHLGIVRELSLVTFAGLAACGSEPVDSSAAGPAESRERGATVEAGMVAMVDARVGRALPTPAVAALEWEVDEHGALALRDPRSAVEVLVESVLALGPPTRQPGGELVARGAGATSLVRGSLGGVEDFIRFDNGTPNHVDYLLHLGEGVGGLRQVASVIEVLDASGAPRMRMQPPYIVDADKERRAVTATIVDCAVDTDPSSPWGRPTTPPGQRSCTLRLALDTAGLAEPILLDPAWTPTGALAHPHTGHGSALLADGRVLVAGGGSNKTELFDPATDTWAVSGDVPFPSKSITRLGDGSVLTLGDTSAARWTAASGSWSPCAAPLGSHGFAPQMVTLADGRGFVHSVALSAEIYDPASDAWTSTAPESSRYEPMLTVLENGRVLALGGYFMTPDIDFPPWQSSAVYDPATDQWTAIPHFGTHFFEGALISLPGSKALAIGGSKCEPVLTDPNPDCAGGPDSYLSQVIQFDGVTNTLTPRAPVPDARARLAAVRLLDGSVLVAGGITMLFDTTASSYRYDPVTDSWSAAGDMTLSRNLHSMTLLADGTPLVTGGTKKFFPGVAEVSAETFTTAPIGSGCGIDNECLSGHCFDGVCCTTACDGLCMACSEAKTGAPDGTCAPISDGIDPDAECIDDGSPACALDGQCDGQGACGTYPTSSGCAPSVCSVDSDCTSGHCAAGICCDSACTGSCQACTASLKGSGVDGVCGPAAAGIDPYDDCAADDVVTCGQDGTCDGSEGCRLYVPLTSCGGSICINGLLELALCNGTGTCLGDNVPCTPYLGCASATACATSCATTQECVAGYTCVNGACVNAGTGGGGAGGDGGAGGVGGGVATGAGGDGAVPSGNGGATATTGAGGDTGPQGASTSGPTGGASDDDEGEGGCTVTHRGSSGWSSMIAAGLLVARAARRRKGGRAARKGSSRASAAPE